MSLVSVVMSAYNAEKYLAIAVDSILAQSFRDFEFVIVDDGSRDATAEIVEGYRKNDSRINFVPLTANVGLPSALNIGLRHASGKYVARFDADDIALPNRLARQVDFMERNPQVFISGGGFHRIDENGQFLSTSFRPRDDYCCRWLNRFGLPLCHPTFIFRRNPSDGQFLEYSTEFPSSEDHEYFGRLLRHGQAVCLPDILISYRIHSGSVSFQKRKNQLSESRRITRLFLNENAQGSLIADLEPFFQLYFGEKEASKTAIAAMVKGVRAMIRSDIASAPERRSWICRQSAQLMVLALRRSGFATDKAATLSLGAAAPGFMPSLALRLLEVKGRLPAWLDSNPAIQT